MNISVLTPSHDSRYLSDCYRSLVSQSYTDWEWVVVLNRGAAAWRPPDKDERATVVRAPTHLAGVGALKRFACQLTKGDVLLELDHDDKLSTDCLSQVLATFRARPEAALAYSDFSQFNADGTPNQDRFDDQDLMSRLYEVGDFAHINRLLYFQRVHAVNTQSSPKTNANIQNETVVLYDRMIRPLASTWAAREGMAQLRLVTETSPPIDETILEDVTMVDPGKPVLAYPDNGVGVIKLIDFLQGIADRAALLNECHRVLCHGGLIITQTPSTDGRGAFQDPSHLSFWNENSFWYLTRAELRFAIRTLNCRLQISRLHHRLSHGVASRTNDPVRVR